MKTTQLELDALREWSTKSHAGELQADAVRRRRVWDLIDDVDELRGEIAEERQKVVRLHDAFREYENRLASNHKLRRELSDRLDEALARAEESSRGERAAHQLLKVSTDLQAAMLAEMTALRAEAALWKARVKNLLDAPEGSSACNRIRIQLHAALADTAKGGG